MKCNGVGEHNREIKQMEYFSPVIISELFCNPCLYNSIQKHTIENEYTIPNKYLTCFK